MKLIDKAAVVEEIEKIIADETESIKSFEHSKNVSEVQRNNARIGVLQHLRSLLDTLEVKEVDLDREIRHYRMNNPIIGHREESLYDYMTNVAKHFFELALSLKNS